jgi:hypothetical protein
MGTIQHDAVIVTGPHDIPFDRGDAPSHIEKAHALAVRLYTTVGLEQLVSPIVRGVMNGTASFLIAPDGSKEGWEHSDRSDQIRRLFKEHLRAEVMRCDCVSVSFGELGRCLTDD